MREACRLQYRKTTDAVQQRGRPVPAFTGRGSAARNAGLNKNRHRRSACLAPRSRQAVQKEASFFSAVRCLTALQACSLYVVLFPSVSDPQHFRFARAGNGTVVCHSSVSHAYASSVLTNRRALWVRPVHCPALLHPKTGAVRCEDGAYACPCADRTRTDSLAARPQGKRCRE